MDISDRKLIERIAAGDRRACADLVNRYGRGLLAVCLGLTDFESPAAAATLAVQTWRQALAENRRRRDRSPLGPHLVEIATGLARVRQAAGRSTPGRGTPSTRPITPLIPDDLAGSMKALDESLRLALAAYVFNRQDLGMVSGLLPTGAEQVRDQLRRALRCLADPQIADDQSGPCHRMQDRIVDQSLGILDRIDSQAVGHHIEGCPRCRRFSQAVDRCQQALATAAARLDPEIQQQCARLRDETHAMQSQLRAARQHGRPAEPRWIAACAAVAVCIIAAVCIGGWWFVRSRNPSPDPAGPTRPSSPDTASANRNTAIDAAEPGSGRPAAGPRIPRAQPGGRNRNVVTVQPPSTAEAMFATHDIQGLIALLDSDQQDQRVAAAGFLAEIGGRESLEPLLRATATWQGNPAQNPYVDALKAILARLSVGEAPPQPPAETGPASTAPNTGDTAGQVGISEATDPNSAEPPIQDVPTEELEDTTKQTEEMEDPNQTLLVVEDPNAPNGFYIEAVDPNQPADSGPNAIGDTNLDTEAYDDGF